MYGHRCELLNHPGQCLQLSGLQFSVVPQLPEGTGDAPQWKVRVQVELCVCGLSQFTILSLNQVLKSLEVQPQNTMDMASATLLELHFVGVVADTEGV